VKVDGGWEVTGRWPLSSGVDNSDWNMLGFIVRERDDGPPVDHRFALCHRSQYEIIDTWHAVGLAGTGSKDVATTKLYVPEYRTISAWAMNGKPHAGSQVNPGLLWKLPLLALGPYVLSGVMLGCAQGAYEQVVGAARKRNATSTGQPVGMSQAIQIKVAEASARIDTAETVMRRVCEHAMAVEGRPAAPRGRYVADQWRHRPDWQFYDDSGEDWFGFSGVRAPVGRSGDIVIVPLPGHTPGHCGVAVRQKDKWLLHAGDAYFFHGQLEARPRMPLLLGLFQRKGDLDRATRMSNQERLRRLKCDHGDRVTIVNSHDPAGYEACRCGEWGGERVAAADGAGALPRRQAARAGRV